MEKARLLMEFSQLLDEIETLEKTASGFYDYKKGCVMLLTSMNKDVIEQGIGKASQDYRKKSVSRIMGSYIYSISINLWKNSRE